MKYLARHLLLVVVGAGGMSCVDDGPVQGERAASSGMVVLTDVNDQPNVVEVRLIAGSSQMKYLSSGSAQVWAYRDGAKPDAIGGVPGPLLEAKQGDQVIVHFRNELPESTTIHWHGLRVPNTSDGTPSTQIEVPPGGEYRYEFVARDAGTFWYHPHVRSDTQIERGLQGMVVVHGGPAIPVTAERAFVFDDVKLDASGTLSESTTSLDIMLGRLGNFLLANGKVDSTVAVASGSRERWRIVNTANGRYFNLRLPGHQFRVIGWDGGLLAEPYTTDTLLVTPGERFDLLVELRGTVGSELPLETVYYDRGHEVPDVGPQPVVKLRFAAEALAPLEPAAVSLGVPPISLVPPADAVTQTIRLGERTINDGADVLFTINDQTFPEVPVIQAREGDVVTWAIQNESEMDHPFHLHGMFFRVLDVNGISPTHSGWKDTVNVPRKSTLRLVVQYGDPGRWMYHCTFSSTRSAG